MIVVQHDEAPERLRRAIEWGRLSILNELDASNINCWIAGGALRALFSAGETIKDVDLFFPNHAEAMKAELWFENKGAKKLQSFETASKWLYKKRVYDVVKVFHSSDEQTPESTLARFDFTIACVAVTKDALYHHDTFWIDLVGKSLVINEPTMPVATLRRLQKFIQRGYTICNGGVVALARAINELPEEAITDENSTLYLD